MNTKLAVGTIVIIAAGLVSGSYYLGRHPSAKASDVPAGCIAGPGEICPSADFEQEIKTLKALSARQRDLNNDPKVKELISVIDQQRGMSERMQQEINQTIQQNPGHAWDGAKEKFVPAAVTMVQPPAPTPAKKP